jgi:hypothetical protein
VETAPTRGLLADLVKEFRARVFRDIAGNGERAVRTGAFGMHHTLRDALAIELVHLLEEEIIFHQNRPRGPAVTEF